MELITVAVAGASGALVKEFASKGAEWIIELVASHSPAVQEKIRKNTEQFLLRLAKRVEALEAELPPGNREIFDHALSHPGTSFLMQKALMVAATTENDDRHEILSELIAQRLTANTDDMISLVGTAACDTVSSLSTAHINLLAVIARLYIIRPKTVQIDSQEHYDKMMEIWLYPVGQLCRKINRVSNLDLMHLIGLSCIKMSVASHDLPGLLSFKTSIGPMKPTMSKLEALPYWNDIKRIWDSELEFIYPTSIGQLIGTLHHDSFTKSKTTINW